MNWFRFVLLKFISCFSGIWSLAFFATLLDLKCISVRSWSRRSINDPSWNLCRRQKKQKTSRQTSFKSIFAPCTSHRNYLNASTRDKHPRLPLAKLRERMMILLSVALRYHNHQSLRYAARKKNIFSKSFKLLLNFKSFLTSRKFIRDLRYAMLLRREQPSVAKSLQHLDFRCKTRLCQYDHHFSSPAPTVSSDISIVPLMAEEKSNSVQFSTVSTAIDIYRPAASPLFPRAVIATFTSL